MHESATYDEPGHIISGWVYWKTHQYALDWLHPPLVRLWGTIPLLFCSLHFPSAAPPGLLTHLPAFYDRILFHNTINGDQLVGLCRAMMCLLGVGLGVLVWKWTKEAFSEIAANAALIAYAFSPVLLSYSHLVTTDFGAAAFAMLTLYSTWRFSQKPDIGTAFLAGLTMGLNLTAKFSGILILPMIFLSLSLEWFFRRPSTVLSWRQISLWILVYFAGMSLLIFSLYHFSLKELHTYWYGLKALQEHLQEGRPTYWAGHIWTGKPPLWFMSAVFFVKTPLPYLLLLVMSGWLLLWKKYPSSHFLICWVCLPMAMDMLGCSVSTSQFGIRRILLIYPMGCIIIGGTVWKLWKHAWGRRIVFLLGCWYVGETLFLFPRYFSYFNECIGGPSQGYRFLLDCNSDWGQGLKGLADYLHSHKTDKTYLAYFGGADPTTYSINALMVAPTTDVEIPRKSIYWHSDEKVFLAISATNRAGLYYQNHHLFDWLLTRSPAAFLMDSIWVYDITKDADAHVHLSTIFQQGGLPQQASLEAQWAGALRMSDQRLPDNPPS